MWVAIDAMSGDHGPDPMVEGTVDAVREYGSHVVLVGEEETLAEILLRHDYPSDHIKIQNATEVIGMEDSPSSAVRSMIDSSLVQALKLVYEKQCVGIFSPGNTGATMAGALFHLGRIKGVERPPIAAPIPRESGPPLVLLDAGANVDCKPEYLVQFAIMGEIYSREVLGIRNPKIGVLSNGEEDKKGSALSVKTLELLKKTDMNLVGNVEGRDLYGGGREVDVVVCDGFVGNIVLKATEGLAKSLFNILINQIRESSLAKTGAILLKPSLTSVKKRLDYAEYGGAFLLGVNGSCLIGHGSSGALAVKNAIRVIQSASRHNITDQIESNIKKYKF